MKDKVAADQVDHVLMTDNLKGVIPLMQSNLLHLLSDILHSGPVYISDVSDKSMFDWARDQHLLHIYSSHSGQALVALSDRGKQMYDEMVSPEFLTSLFSRK